MNVSSKRKFIDVAPKLLVLYFQKIVKFGNLTNELSQKYAERWPSVIVLVSLISGQLPELNFSGIGRFASHEIVPVLADAVRAKVGNQRDLEQNPERYK